MSLKSFILLSLLPCLLFGQTVNENKLVSNAKFSGVQLEAIGFLTVYGIGVSTDFDLMSSANKKYHLGTRINAEYYNYLSLDVGGKTAPGPFFDINFYGQHSIVGENFGVTSFLGFSFHNSLEKNKSTNLLFLPRGGVEWKYNLSGDGLFLLFKLESSFREETTLGGLGFLIRFNND